MSQLLQLPISPADLLSQVIARACSGKFRSPEADVLLIAIALQESGLRYRWQIVDPLDHSKKGPARGLWQFERAGGCAGVLTHSASRKPMAAACLNHGVNAAPRDLWNALEADDLLACKAARLLLFTDPHPLPKVGHAAEGWRYYERNWRPGKPHPQTWSANYAAALEAVHA